MGSTIVLEDDQQMEILASNSRIFAEQYSVEKIAERVSSLYRRVVVITQSRS